MQLNEFFEHLEHHPEQVPIDRLVEHMRALDLTVADVAEHVQFADDRYKRNLVRLGSGYVALILCWRSGQSSPIHDHAGSACGVRVLRGVATERKYDRADDGTLTEVWMKRYQEGSVCGSYDADIHTLVNEQPAGHDLVTLHVYTPPMHEFHTYSLESPEVRTMVDREVEAARAKMAAR